MDMRTTKQVVYGGAFLGIFLFVATWFYFLVVKPAPSCFDQKQNQNEEGVDCGGVCAQICLPSTLQPVSAVDDVQTFFPASNKLTLLARLKNPNDTHGATVSYVISVYGENNTILSSITDSVTLYPSQVQYIIVPSIDLENASKKVDHADLRFQSVDWQTAESMHKPQVSVRDQSSQITGKFISVTGNITNSDIVDVPKVTAIAIFYNQFNIAIGAARTELPNLASGETRSFTINHPFLPSLQAQKTQIVILTD